MKVTDSYAADVLQLLDNTLGIFHHDLARGKLNWNRAMYRLHGLDADRPEPPTMEELDSCLHIDDRARTRELAFTAIHAKHTCETYYRVVKKDQSIVHIHARYESVWSDQGQCFVGSCSEVTELKKALDGLEHRRQKDLSRLLRTVSHEIRNPLQGMIAGCENLLTMLGEDKSGGSTDCDGMSPPHLSTSTVLKALSDGDQVQSVVETVCDLLECSTHQSVVVNSLLDYDSILQKVKEPVIEPVDIDALSNSVVSMFRTCAKNKGIQLFHTMPDVHRIVATDGSIIKRILMNIVSNSVKFTPSGSQNYVSVVVNYAKEDEELTIAITDTGVGIPEAFKSQLFSTIGLTTTNSEYINGSGLGLSICKTLADSLGGCLMFRDNGPRGGTVMQLCLQCEHIPEPSVHTNVSIDKQNTTCNIEGEPAPLSVEEIDSILKECKVLVSEDNIINQKVLRRMLTAKVGDLVVTSDGQEAVHAVSALREQGGKFDCFLLDVHMPNLDGKDCAAVIRKTDGDTPIMFLTGEIGEGLEGVEARFSPCKVLPKPYGAAILLSTMAHMIRDRDKKKDSSIVIDKISKVEEHQPRTSLPPLANTSPIAKLDRKLGTLKSSSNNFDSTSMLPQKPTRGSDAGVRSPRSKGWHYSSTNAPIVQKYKDRDFSDPGTQGQQPIDIQQTSSLGVESSASSREDRSIRSVSVPKKKM